MLLTIYDKSGAKRADVAASDSSTQSKEVQGDNVLALSFTHYAHIPLDVGDFTDYMGERYWLTERYTPKEKSGSEWEYNLKLYGIESLIKRFLVLETTDGDTNPLFTLTATPREHVAMVVKAINDGMGHITDWKVGQVDGTDLIVIDYEGMYCDQALKEIAVLLVSRSREVSPLPYPNVISSPCSQRHTFTVCPSTHHSALPPTLPAISFRAWSQYMPS